MSLSESEASRKVRLRQSVLETQEIPQDPPHYHPRITTRRGLATLPAAGLAALPASGLLPNSGLLPASDLYPTRAYYPPEDSLPLRPD